MLRTLIVDLFGQAGLVIVPLAILYGVYHFGRRTADVPWLLAFAASVLSIAGLILMQVKLLSDDIAGNNLPDPTGVTYVIVLLFGTALLCNAKTFWKVNRELHSERKGQEGATRRNLRNCLHRRSTNSTSLEDAVAEIDAELDAREDVPRLIKKMLPTLGLIGTVIGLAIAMNELGGALSAAVGGKGDGSEALLLSMQGALSGMGGAFITTLFGAGFGMLLMVLITRTRLMLTHLVSEAKRRLDDEGRKTADQPKPPRPPKARFRPDMN
ncbi:MotA/TolQ/ExbB proton channel family protein [Adhaeretor mobilis]|uniref:MotA/TolQ/ExbB proton channel family protein n=1 Tax=Adhaeretor mobilis TaxID=1930276 RepID=A0A517MQC0_9BACT|nr:MotA/TolQ/ExbB proton channel family protein [Adhaeretor mobilis]QDS97078.1 MotA/TolQ/ExbB proton channel family protein [Adhaeretor mobilis]